MRWLVLFVALMAAPVLAQDGVHVHRTQEQSAAEDAPKAVITGPTGGMVGDILMLDASESVADHYLWLVDRTLPDGRQTIMPIEGGRRCFVTSAPGQRTVTLVVSTSGGMAWAKQTITVGPGPDPGPGPGPDPDPPEPDPEPEPDPVPPDPISRDIRELVQRHVASQHRSAASTLAQNFESLAAQASAGAINSVDQLLKRTAEANIDALGGRDSQLRKEWAGFNSAVSQYLSELSQSGKLKTLDDHAGVWRSIAAGLHAATADWIRGSIGGEE